LLEMNHGTFFLAKKETNSIFWGRY
jgi:hypothetical protein